MNRITLYLEVQAQRLTGDWETDQAIAWQTREVLGLSELVVHRDAVLTILKTVRLNNNESVV